MIKSIQKSQNNKGFTLIELVVVIAILAILAAIAVPQLLGFQERAREQADNQTAAQIKNSVALLYANNEITLDDDLTDTVYTDATSTATFTIDNTGTVTVAVDLLYDSAGVDHDAASLEALLLGATGLVADFDLQGDRDIQVTVNGAGAVSAILVN